MTSSASARHSRTAVSRALIDVCSGAESPVPPGGVSAAELVDAARFHRIAPLARLAYRRSAPELSMAFEVDRIRAMAMHLQACGALRQLADALADVRWAAFKGPVFSELAHPAPGLRTYHDVDVLVAPLDLREVSHRLLAAGWHVADFRDMLLNPATPGEMHWISPGGVIVDLHWSMVNMAVRRAKFAVPTTSLLQRRTSVMFGTQPVWTLDPIDSLAHACMHAALAGADKLLYLVDVDRLSRNLTEWHEVAVRSREWRAQAQVALVLGRARLFLGTELPTDLNRRLGVPASVIAMASLADRVAPVPQGLHPNGLARFVARAIQPTASATLGTAGCHAVRGVVERTVGVRSTPVERAHADPAALRAYIEAVEALASRGPA